MHIKEGGGTFVTSKYIND